MALEFIFQIDELLFRAMAPHRLRGLLANLEPLPIRPLPRQTKRGYATVVTIGKALMVLLPTCLLYFFVLQETNWRLQQAIKILCSGNKQFVFEKNQATGIAQVAWSRLENHLELEDLDVLQHIGLDLQDNPYWLPEESVMDVLNSGVRMVKVVEGNGTAPFDQVMRHLVTPAAQAARDLPCTDNALELSNEATARYMSRVINRQTGSKNWTMCPPVTSQELIPEMCSNPVYPYMRAICPVFCQCHRNRPSNFFATNYFGCPTRCFNLAADTDPCMDASPAAISLPGHQWGSEARTWLLGAVSFARRSTSFEKKLTEVLTMMYSSGIAVGVVTPADWAACLMTRRMEEVVEEMLTAWSICDVSPSTPLVGCAFFTTDLVAQALGTRPCLTGVGRSVRFMCPVTCTCPELGLSSRDECPSTCFANATSLNSTSPPPGTAPPPLR